jgi:hypothetical protein
MRQFVIVAVWLAIVMVPGLAAGQDTDALRRELDQLRRQQEQYQKAIEALSERLERLERSRRPRWSHPSRRRPPWPSPRPVRRRPRRA